MTWQEDLRHLAWNGTEHTVLDRIEEGGRVFLGLALSGEVAGVAQARNQGGVCPAPAALLWVEEAGGELRALSRQEVKSLIQRRLDRAAQAFRRP